MILESKQKPILGIGGGQQNTNWKREMIATGCTALILGIEMDSFKKRTYVYTKDSRHAGNMDFETVMNAIRSNSGRYGYKDVRLTFRRTEKSVPRSTETLKRSAPVDAAKQVDLPIQTRRDEWDK